jgi:hypothetical protein
VTVSGHYIFMTKREAKKMSRALDSSLIEVGHMASGGSWWAIRSLVTGQVVDHGWGGKGDLDAAHKCGEAARANLSDEVVAANMR